MIGRFFVYRGCALESEAVSPELEFESQYNKKLLRWVPKSQSPSSYDLNETRAQGFQIALWFLYKQKWDTSRLQKNNPCQTKL